MSNALAIAGVTAVLRDLLNDGFIDHDLTLGDVTVSSLAPDLINEESSTARLNMFFYQATPNQGWRNACQPTRNARGQRVSDQPLALDLHYLLTAYGSEEFHPEVLLGYAMQILHETPVLSRDAIRRSLNPNPGVGDPGAPPPSLPDYLRDLSTTGLAEQVEQIKIVPEMLGSDDIFKLWSAFQAKYRPTAAYGISVVLIEPQEPASSPLPVLQRGPGDVGALVQTNALSPYPELNEVEYQGQQTTAVLGSTIRLKGRLLDGQNVRVLFSHPELTTPLEITPLVSDVSDTEVSFTLEINPATDPTVWQIGVYQVHIVLTIDGTERQTSALPFSLSPLLTTNTNNTVGTTTTFTIQTSPQTRLNQSAALLFGDHSGTLQDRANQSDPLLFEFEDAPTGTPLPVRLRVNGLESHFIDRMQSPPVFLPSALVTL